MRHLLTILILALVATTAPLKGASYSWKNNASGNWGTAGNWNPGGVPNSGSDSATLGAIISTARTVALGGNTYRVGTLTINGGSHTYTIGSSVGDGKLNIYNTSNVGNLTAQGTSVINSDIGAQGTFNFNQSGGTLTLNGSLEQNWYTTVNKTGAGTVIFNAANDFSGPVNVQAGTLIAANNLALGDSNAVTVSSGASLALQGGISLDPGAWAITLEGNGNGGNPAALYSRSGNNTWEADVTTSGAASMGAASGASLTILGAVHVDNALLVTGAGNTILAGGSNGSSTLSKDGTGTLQLTGSDNFTGDAININEGTLQLNLTSATIGGDLTVGNGTNAVTAIYLANNQIANHKEVTVLQGSTLNLAGYSDEIRALNLTGATVQTGAGTLTLNLQTGAIETFASSVTSTLSGKVAFTGYQASLDIANGAAAVDLNINAQITSTNNGLIKNGTGTLSLSGTTANTVSGLIINSGTVELNKTAGVNAVSSGVIAINSGGTLLLRESNQIGNSTTMTLNGGTFNTNGKSETLGAMTLSANSTLDLGSGASILQFANSSSLIWAGMLTIQNWNKGVDALFFGNSAAGLTSTQINQIQFNIGGTLYGAQLLATGELVAVPEAKVILAALLLVGMVLFKERRKIRALYKSLRLAAVGC